MGVLQSTYLTAQICVMKTVMLPHMPKKVMGGTSQIKSIVGFASIQTDTIGPVHL